MKSNRVDKEAMNMEIPKIHESEYRFCLIMWEHEPVTAVELVKLCQDQLGWKRTTTYTVIKRLGERGVLKNDNGTVTSLVSKDDAYRDAIEKDGLSAYIVSGNWESPDQVRKEIVALIWLSVPMVSLIAC